MKLNWGHYILISFSLFVGLIVYMVIRSYGHKNDLVAENYYQKEIEFQDVINKKKNALTLEQDLTWQSTTGAVVVDFPNLEGPIAGEIVLFRPSDKAKDLMFNIEVDSRNQQRLESEKLIPGKYLIQIDWSSGKELYFTEGTVFVKGE